LNTLRCILILIAGLAIGLRAEDSPSSGGPVGVVSHIKLLTDKTEDLTDLEAWKKTYIKDGMTDQEKAIAIWKTVIRYRHQDTPPNEGVQSGTNVHDPMRTIHVYGYGQCCCASSNIEGLARYIGLQARGRIICNHSVPEVFYDDAWHLFDASVMDYFIKTDGKAASVDEIRKSVMDWHVANPGYRQADNKLREFAKGGNWRTKGPELLAGCKTYDDNGINGAGWHGWPSTMQEYDIKDKEAGVYEYGPTLGYELNIQLRPGEKLIRNWSNKGWHVNMPEGNPQVLGDMSPLKLQREFGDKSPGRIGNGTLEYTVPLAGAWKASALSVDNIADDKVVRLKDAAQPGSFVIRMPSNYVYLSGTVEAKAVVANGGSITVALSDNNGLDWKEVKKITASGDEKLDLKALVYRHYDYRLKFDIAGAGTGLDALKITHDIQHSQAPLPLILEGDNKISFSSARQEGTITYEPCMGPEDAKKWHFPSYLDYHPKINALDAPLLRVGDSGAGDATFTVNTPGDMTKLRMSYHWRARDAKDGYDVQVSFDDGKTFKTVERLGGPTAGCTKYFPVNEVPAGTRKALVKLVASQRNTTCLFDMRIDADYKEPHGGFAPVKITYAWEEDGKAKTDVHIAKSATDEYTIKCGPKTVAKSVTLELGDK
jgi:hypothetical protein